MPRPYTALVPTHIAWYPSVADFAAKGGRAPINNLKPQKLWKDNSPASPGMFWASLATSAREYNFIARDQSGAPLLCKIDSPEFYRTYTSLSVVNTYREFSYMFTAGVPYVVSGSVSAENADMNLGSNGATIDYPVQLPTNVMLLVENGEVVAYDYQEFLRMAKPPAMPDTERVKMIDQVRASGLPASEQIKAIRTICTDYYPEVRLT